jgi:hypothetical protein
MAADHCHPQPLKAPQAPDSARRGLSGPLRPDHRRHPPTRSPQRPPRRTHVNASLQQPRRVSGLWPASPPARALPGRKRELVLGRDAAWTTSAG